MSSDSKRALVSMILAIVSLVFVWYFSTGFYGIIFAVIALALVIVSMVLRKPVKAMTENPGRVFVKIGTIFSIIGLVLAIISIILSIVLGVTYSRILN